METQPAAYSSRKIRQFSYSNRKKQQETPRRPVRSKNILLRNISLVVKPKNNVKETKLQAGAKEDATAGVQLVMI